jgi:hypothetical protein
LSTHSLAYSLTLGHRCFSRYSSYTSHDEDAAIYSLYDQAKGSFNNAAQAAAKNSPDQEKMLRLAERVGLHMEYFTWADGLKQSSGWQIKRDQLAEWVGRLAKFDLWQQASELCRCWLVAAAGAAPVAAAQDGGDDEHAQHLYKLVQQIVAVSSMLYILHCTHIPPKYTRTPTALTVLTPHTSPI